MNYISSKDTAKLVREVLKKSFPGIKFSVTSKNSIRVSWVDGPTTAEVKEVAGHFHGTEFDGMQDLASPNGRPYLNDYIFFSRSYTVNAIEEAAKKFSSKYGSDIEIPEIKTSNYDGHAYMNGDGGTVGCGGRNRYWSARETIMRILENKDQ